MDKNSTRHSSPVLLGDLFDQAREHLHQQASATPRTDGFIFSGNHHDSVPRALLLDKRLTPLERNAWQVLRLLLNTDGITAFPTYEQLAPWLASMPCNARASHETVARVLTILRLTRWISLVRRRRDPATGRILGNLYVLHDEPLTPYEAIQLDAHYLSLLGTALTHASKSVQRVAEYTVQEIATDPQLRHQLLPDNLQILSQRLRAQDWASASYPQADAFHGSEEGEKAFLRNQHCRSSVSEAGEKTSKTAPLRDPKQDRTVRIKKEEIRTVPRTRETLRFPERFMALKAEQRSGALSALQAVESEFHQAILEEWDARCKVNAVRNPTGYLFGIIQKALRGEFHARVGQKPAVATALPEPKPSSGQPAGPEASLAHIAQLRSLLRRG